MDTKTNTFLEMSEEEAKLRNLEDPGRWVAYPVGRVVVLDGHRFKVRKVTRKDLILRPIGPL